MVIENLLKTVHPLILSGLNWRKKKSLIFRLSGTFYSFVPKLLPKEKKE